MQMNLCKSVGNMQATNQKINLAQEEKVQVLLHALSERYNAIHVIRDRVQNVCLWTLGLFITAGGWLLQSDKSLRATDKILFSIAIVVSVAVLRIFYLRDLE